MRVPRSMSRNPMTSSISVALSALVLASGLAAGCAGPAKTFQRNFDVVYTQTPDRITWRDGSPGVYRNVDLEPLRLFVRDRGSFDFRAPGQLAIEYRRVLTTVLGDDYPVVDEADRDTLRVEARLTDRIATPQLRERGAGLGIDPATGGADRILLEVRFFDVDKDRLVAALASKAESAAFERNLRRPDRGSIREAFVPLAMGLHRALDDQRLRAPKPPRDSGDGNGGE